MATLDTDLTATNSPPASLHPSLSRDPEKPDQQTAVLPSGAPAKLEPLTVETSSPEDDKYYHGTKLYLSQVAMLLSVFLVALDQTITSTAIPHIASEFNSLNDVTWIASAYLLTDAGLLMLYGQLLIIAPTKWVYIAAVTIFEIGSLISGVAPTVNVLIFGRAFAGVGAAGIMVTVQSILAQIAAIQDRPLLFACFAGVFALSSVIGPLLGGAFSDHVTWRWCFYINLPIGAVSIAVIMLIIEARPAIGSEATDGMTTIQRWMSIDWIGAILSIGMVVALILPLQWGGNLKPWNAPAVIATFCVFGVVLVAFIAWEWHMGARALVPLKMLKHRTQIGACLEAFWIMLCMLLAAFYLPLGYQARGHSATQSGIDILPFMLSTVLTAGLSGAVITFTGRYWPFLLTMPLATCIGGGLLFTIDTDTSSAKLIGFQILYGIGIGAAMQNTVIAIQAEYATEERLVPQATSLVNFAQLIGGVIGICIAGTVFANQLSVELAQYAPGLPTEVQQAIRETFLAVRALPDSEQGAVIKAYTKALDYVYIIGVPAAAMAALSALCVRNLNLKEVGKRAAEKREDDRAQERTRERAVKEAEMA